MRMNIDDQSKILVVGSCDLKVEWTTETAETIRCKMVGGSQEVLNLEIFHSKIPSKISNLFSFLFKLKINSFFFKVQIGMYSFYVVLIIYVLQI